MGVEAKVSVDVDRVDVAKPCPADWEAMSGDERVRHCGDCQLNVYNLSGMTREEGAALIQEHESERLCVRLFRRADGTVITQECPVGLAAFRRRVRRVFTGIGALALMLCAAIGWRVKEKGLRGIPLPVIVDPEPEIVMGIMCAPPVPPTPPLQGSQ